MLRRIVARSGQVFWPDDVSWVEGHSVPHEAIVGRRQVTDAHLIALAVRHGGRLATFDRGILELAGDLEPAPVELIR